jgi:hypothetical protein
MLFFLCTDNRSHTAGYVICNHCSLAAGYPVSRQ